MMRSETFLGVMYPVLLDGAMGTQLAARGLEMGGQNCLLNPETVRDIHRAYVEAGADILITNTLTMNRIYIETHKLGVGVEEVNIAGARLAREASGDRPVLGDISSTGQLLEPYGECSEEQAFAAFREQARHLANAGVDGFIVETMLDLREALCAARACRAVADLPVVMTLSFQTSDHGGRTIMGNSAAEIAEAASVVDVVAVGANCGSLDPSQTAAVLAIMRAACSLPLVAQPNAGIPRLSGGVTIFDMNSTDFATGIADCLRSGARLVGGCCGTSPEHIRQTRNTIDRMRKETTTPPTVQ
ncbi:MAG: homocysteine S-methyltransferase family protein [Kiritimatiellae bacterium]|nr:homocysteine S-methyltransferase family protein [Kiritimatiellia bacterium]MDD5520893.1 homocysteine S-methyltransferase family protein [Kiritimatiellia bacterium]